MNFRVGQKVVCVDATVPPDEDIVRGAFIWECRGDLDGLREGAIYTVRSVTVCFLLGAPLLLLNEIIRSNPEEPSEPGFLASRFRPVVERKTDISIFKEMLVPQRKLALTSTMGAKS